MGASPEPLVPYDPALAERVRDLLHAREDVEEKRMFGGIAFMVGGHMAVGVLDDRLVVRMAPDDARALLDADTPGLRPMDFTGRPMKGWLYAEGPAIEDDEALAHQVGHGLAFVGQLPPRKGRR